MIWSALHWPDVWAFDIVDQIPSDQHSLFKHAPPVRHTSLLRMGQLCLINVDSETGEFGSRHVLQQELSLKCPPAILITESELCPEPFRMDCFAEQWMDTRSPAEIRFALSDAPAYDSHVTYSSSVDEMLNHYEHTYGWEIGFKDFAAFFSKQLRHDQMKDPPPLLSCLQIMTRWYVVRIQWIVSASARAAQLGAETREHSGGLSKLRDGVQVHLVELRTAISEFKKFTNRNLNVSEESDKKAVREIGEQLEEALTELNEAVSLVREVLDMQVARRSLEESQKSIEMAKLSILESKRVKLRMCAEKLHCMANFLEIEC